MDFFRPHQAFELLRAVDTRGEDRPLHLLNNQIDRLYGARRLFRKDDPEIGHFLPGTGDRVFAPVPDRDTRNNNDNEEQPNSDKGKVSAGAKTLI
jgi:uncharacterized heparinase superfamily protein